MSKNDDELNEFIDEVTDGAYNLPCVEVIFKLVKQMQPWGDERIKKIVAALAVEGIKIFIAADIWYSYSCPTQGRTNLVAVRIRCVSVRRTHPHIYPRSSAPLDV
jgi:hypothetical protein